jgi:hypothetical protein
MWRRFTNAIYRRGIQRALALHLRGEARRDGLKLKKLSNRLEIEWWVVRQSLADTEAAITRLFQNLPQVNAIALTVLDHNSESVIMAGRVYRSEPEPGAELSVGMRLWKRGVKYHSDGWVFEPLGSGDGLDVLASGSIAG